ncbi:helix-turn-helix transcriptional regulator [Pseudomonas fluorescens]
MTSPVHTYEMRQRSDHADFYIRDQLGRPALTSAHKHDYFQIQLNLGGDTRQHIGGAVRSFPTRAVAFILPHRLHLIPHPRDSQFVLINFTQQFLLPQLSCDALDLEDASVELYPELAPFLFQEHLDFILNEAGFEEAVGLLTAMQKYDAQRGFGATARLRGLLLQLIGMVCELYGSDLQLLSARGSVRQGRRDALGRVRAYLREHLHEPSITLKDVAEAVFLSPNYLTHLLRKETGRSFSHLLLDRRMALARTLLLHSNDSVGQIASACGFADESYFSRCFRKVHGLPPGQYRRAEARSSLR